MNRTGKKAYNASLYATLMDGAINEIVAVEKRDMSAVVDFTTDYEWLISELARMKKNTERVFIVAWRFSKPEKLAIFTKDDYKHHPLTMQSREYHKKRQQKESLRKRINDYKASGKAPKFSSIEG